MHSGKSSKIAELDGPTTVCLFRVAAIVVGGIIFSVFVDVGDPPIVFAAFLSTAAMLRGTAAALAGDEFWAYSLNRWDEAALLTFVSFLSYSLAA